MNFKKLLAGPFVWIFVAVMVLLIGSSMVNGKAVKTVDTAYGLNLIENGAAKQVTVLGNDQRVDVVLDYADAKYGDHIQFYYVASRGPQVADAIAAADITLIRPSLTTATDALRVAKRTVRIIKSNLAWAFAYNLICIPIAASGNLSPMYAGAAMSLSSLFVVVNSLRISR